MKNKLTESEIEEIINKCLCSGCSKFHQCCEDMEYCEHYYGLKEDLEKWKQEIKVCKLPK